MAVTRSVVPYAVIDMLRDRLRLTREKKLVSVHVHPDDLEIVLDAAERHRRRQVKT